MRIQAIVAAALLLAGCAKEYAYIPPTDAEGRACVARCQTAQTDCRRAQDRRAADAQDLCEAEAARREDKCEIEATVEYAACLKFAKTDADRAACDKKDCTPPSCQKSGDYGFCASDYRTCFQSCGGTIDILD